MQGAYGGLIMIILYGGGISAPFEEFFLITQNNLDIITQTSIRILVQE
jgi:hypothetical protein